MWRKVSVPLRVSGQEPFQCKKGEQEKEEAINKNIKRHRPDWQVVREAVMRHKPGQSH